MNFTCIQPFSPTLAAEVPISWSNGYLFGNRKPTSWALPVVVVVVAVVVSSCFCFCLTKHKKCKICNWKNLEEIWEMELQAIWMQQNSWQHLLLANRHTNFIWSVFFTISCRIWRLSSFQDCTKGQLEWKVYKSIAYYQGKLQNKHSQHSPNHHANWILFSLIWGVTK